MHGVRNTMCSDAPTSSNGLFFQSTGWKETNLLVQLSFLTVVIQLQGVLPPFLVASYVGRNFGSVYLDGFTLASVTGNLFTLSLLSGIFSASDTLGPQAFGANNKREVGLLAIRGFVGSMIILLPINLVLVCYMSSIMSAILGQDAEVSGHAWHWYRIYALCLPFYALYQATWKFLSAQNVMMPLLVVTFLSTWILLPIVLWLWTSAAGFLGTAWAIVTYQVTQSLGLVFFLYWRSPHSVETWPGLAAWRNALEWKKFVPYMVRQGRVFALSIFVLSQPLLTDPDGFFLVRHLVLAE
jgi:Na+-driven multidrug efflux pump